MSISGGAVLHKLQKPGQTSFFLLRFPCQSSILGLRPTSPFGATNEGNLSQVTRSVKVGIYRHLYSVLHRLGLEMDSWMIQRTMMSSRI
ncbi:hypothetical protein Ahy_A02g009049 [Arachis hypogaea]|uniref:Uncharacterized protein n=1 Tax=Arachis hypogaea TaxID=3818 RepID=A0A445EGA1_ARAHY|nr:hypothetical protein Ahy_A02g009049 [Arachis hypogaea]